jgi:hypothetical protein
VVMFKRFGILAWQCPGALANTLKISSPENTG